MDAFNGDDRAQNYIVGVDTSANVDGGSDQVLNAGPNVVGTADVVNGGAGVDTLNWYADSAVNRTLVGSYSNIENINLFGADNLIDPADLADYQDLVADVGDAQAALGSAETAQDATAAALASASVATEAADFDLIAASTLRTEADAFFVWEYSYDSENGADQNGSWRDDNPTIPEMLYWLQYTTMSDVDNSVADTAVYNAAVAAAGAASATVNTVYAAIVGAIQEYEDAQTIATAAETAADTANDDAVAAETAANTSLTNAENALDAFNANLTIDAAFFEGSKHITTDGAVAGFTNVDGHTITFTSVTVSGDIELAEGATEVTVVYDGTTDQGLAQDDLDVWSILADGDAQGTLTTLNITSDTIENVTIWAEEANTLNLNISSNAVIDVNYLGQETNDVDGIVEDLATINSTGTGDITLNIIDGAAIESINTAGGDDTVSWKLGRIDYALDIVTGAGSDTVEFLGDIDNVLTQDAALTVDLGADNDTFDVANILITDLAPEITNVDGGAGSDTLKSLMVGFQTEETYVRLNEDFVNFETLVLTQYDDTDADALANVDLRFTDGLTPVEIDASKLANFTRFELTGFNDYNGSYGDTEGPIVFNNVLSTQTISTQFDWIDGAGGGAVNVTADGYDVAGADVADIHAEHITPVGGGRTHTEWEMYGDNATIDITNNSVEDAEQGAEVELIGDVNTLTINIDGGFTSGDGYAEIDLTADEVNLSNLVTVTVNGLNASHVSVYNYEGSALATIDASGMDATGLTTDNDYSDDFYYESTNASVVESIKLGDSVDSIYFGTFTDIENNDQWGSNRGHMDTITGFDFETDVLDVDGFDFTLVAEEDLVGSSLATILQNLATNVVVDEFVFQYKGNTYLYIDEIESAAANTLSTNDFLVKVVGTTDMEVNTSWVNLTIV